METTKVESAKTVSEISYLLSQAGATRVMHDYRDGLICGVSFTLEVAGQTIPFRLPANVEPVFKIINGRRRPNLRQKSEQADREPAVRVAWRQILRWIQAQLALIETGMVASDEVFLPYIRLADGRTLYNQFQENGMKKMLPYLGAQ